MSLRTFGMIPLACITLALCASQCDAQKDGLTDSSATLAIPDSYHAISDAPTPLTFSQKAALYGNRTFSIHAVLAASYAAGLAQWRGTPREWGAGISGYARRDAAAYGAGIIRHTTEFGMGALLHEDPRFERSTRNGFSARTVDALHNTIFVRTDDGRHRVAWSRAAAALATGFAVNSWEPRRLRSTHHAFILSLAGLAGYGTVNITREFTPDVRRFISRKLHIGDDR